MLNIVTVWKVFFPFSTYHHHHHLLALTKPTAYQLVYRQIFLNNSNQHISASDLLSPLVIEARSDAVRARLHRNPECQVHESRQIGSGQTGDGKSEC